MSVTESVTIESRERGAFKSTMPGGIVPGPRIQRPPISPAEQIRAKLDARLLEVIRRAARNERVETAFVRAGRAEVQVFLTEKTEAVRAQLRELGFEMIADPSSKLITSATTPMTTGRASSDDRSSCGTGISAGSGCPSGDRSCQ